MSQQTWERGKEREEWGGERGGLSKKLIEMEVN